MEILKNQIDRDSLSIVEDYYYSTKIMEKLEEHFRYPEYMYSYMVGDKKIDQKKYETLMFIIEHIDFVGFDPKKSEMSASLENCKYDYVKFKLDNNFTLSIRDS